MRSLFLLGTIFAILPASWIYPQVGVLVWSWISFMSPHQQVWGGADAFRLNLIVAIITNLGCFFSNHTKKLPINSTAVFLFLFVVFTSLSTYFSLVPNLSFELWNRYMKSFMLLFMILVIMNNRVRVHSVIWIIVISIGYYGVQGGLIGIISGGNNNFTGPPSSQIADNNAMALAMIITIPLMNYLRITSSGKLVKFILLISMILTVMAVLSTYSRGGLIGLSAMLMYLWIRNKKKLIPLIVAACVLVPVFLFMPQNWWNRMDTIETAAASEGSFQTRLAAWETSFNLAVTYPILGGGLTVIENPSVYVTHRPVGDTATTRTAHSIYFQILGDQGFVGLTIYLLFLYTGWRNSSIVLRIARRANGLAWAEELARMSQVSMVGFFVAGSALSMAYYDVFLTIIVLQSSLRNIVEAKAM